MATRATAWSIAATAGVLVVAASACGHHGRDDVGSNAGAIELGVEGSQFAVAVGLSGAMRDAQRATASLRTPFRGPDGSPTKGSDGTPLVATCGVTFVDRHLAVTAAHCVSATSVPDPATRLEVGFIDVDETTRWREAAKLSGTFPRYTHPPITGTYRVSTIRCTVAVRCKTDYGLLHCPPEATDGDVAVLTCDPGLPDDRSPVAVADADPAQGAEVQAFWFHEIYDVPLVEPRGDAAARDLFSHYTGYDGAAEDNYHYYDGRNQLLPLISVPFSTGEPRRRGETVANGPTEFWTDIYGCHGTSGSGFMHLGGDGHYQLLGPAVANSGLGGIRLCTDPTLLAPGKPSISFTKSNFTRAAVAAARALQPTE